MVVIRLSRTGAKKSPFYHIIATDKRSKRDGRFIERLGYYNPVARGNDKKLVAQRDRLDYWLSNGAQMSDRVQYLVGQLETA